MKPVLRAMTGWILTGAAALAVPVSAENLVDHFEFDAMLAAPYRADANGRRDIELQFRFPGAVDRTVAVWRLELLGSRDRVIRSWRGDTRLTGGRSDEVVSWYERDPRNGLLPDGHYRFRLTSTALDTGKLGLTALGFGDKRIDDALAAGDAQQQEWSIEVGNVPPAQITPMPAMAFADNERPVLASAEPTKAESAKAAANGAITQASAPAPGGLPYTVYLANLHSQANHSDGGGALTNCTSSQAPQAGAFGPADAFTYSRGRNTNILAVTEHNHYADGSTGTNTSANPTTAINRYQSGLSAATSFNSANPGFLGVYGMEWGVINNGGHLNIFNSNELLAWESNSSGQLIGNTFTEQGNYQALYTLMRSRGWIGQFNHPATTGQFQIGGTPLAYTADGDNAMVLCEVLNSSAFSTNTSETETGRSSYESACNTLLERGYHVAFSTNQDNHCANWSASYTNRTGVLLPNGTALTQASFVAALRARRVYASTDRTSQIALTANGRLMGETFSNSGPLTLTVNYAPGPGRSASQIQVFRGVPGRNGTVTQLSTTATTTLTPTVGAHFFYARITQNNGTILWTAPVWVNQTAGATPTELLTNGGFESGATGWTASTGVITNSTARPARTGSWKAWLLGNAVSSTETVSRNVTIPAAATNVTFSFWLRIDTAETTTTTAWDTMQVQVRNTAGTVLATLGTYSNLNAGASYVQRSFNLNAYRGQTVNLFFTGTEGSTLQTSFVVDDVSVLSQ